MRASHSDNRDGVSLVEVLIAIVILLVGVYSVAKGFPQLLQTIENNKTRSERTRDARAILDVFVGRPFGLPFAVTYDPDNDGDGDPSTVTPLPEPVDPTTAPTPNPDPDHRLNARDDMYRVVGETFVLPRYVGTGDPVCVHVLDLGPAYYGGPASAPSPSPLPNYKLRPDVYELVPLKWADTSGSYAPGEGLEVNEFDVVGFELGPDDVPATVDDATGMIILSRFVARAMTIAGKIDPGPDGTLATADDLSVDELVADYSWMDTNGNLHFASDVRVPVYIGAGTPVAYLTALNPTTIDPNGFDLYQIMKRSVRLRWKNHFLLAGDADPAVTADWSSPTAVSPNEYQVDNVLYSVAVGPDATPNTVDDTGPLACFSLAFNPIDATDDVFGDSTRERVMRVDYFVAVERPALDDREERPPTQPRQVVIMSEDHRVPLEANGTDDVGQPIHRVKLRAKFLDVVGQMPFALDPATGEGVHVVAVDLHDGRLYSDNIVILPTDPLLTTEGLARVGEVFFYDTAPVLYPGDPSAAPPIPPSEHRAHELRFYYRGQEEPTQRLQKAAATFIEGLTDTASDGGPGDGFPDFAADIDGDGLADSLEEGYREYRADPTWDPASGLFRDLSKIAFRRSCIGQAVAVDYLWDELIDLGPDGVPLTPDDVLGARRRANGELHVIEGDGFTPDQNPVSIHLRHNPDGASQAGRVHAIVAVRGVSVRSIAWWRQSNGRLTRTDVHTYLTSPLG